MPPQFIYTMYQLKKIVPSTQREILRGITLAFFPDAKIGVLGPNGAGKSTLLRIMAGVDRDFVGDARITEGYRAGLLAQEPAQPYTVIAIVSVSSGYRGLDAIRNRLLKEAARLGGEAVLLETASLTTVPTGGGEHAGTGPQLSGKVIVFNREPRATNTP